MEFAIVFDKKGRKIEAGAFHAALHTRRKRTSNQRLWNKLAVPGRSAGCCGKPILSGTPAENGKYLPNIKIVGIEFVHNPGNGEATAKISCRRRENSE